MGNVSTFKDLKPEIVKFLNQKMQNNHVKCGSCGSNKMTLVDGISNDYLQDDIGGGLSIGGPTIPKILLVCDRCGYINYYALKALIPNNNI